MQHAIASVSQSVFKYLNNLNEIVVNLKEVIGQFPVFFFINKD